MLSLYYVYCIHYVCIHLFHFYYIYIAPLQVELLRGAPDSSAAEKSSFEMREEGGRKGPGEETKGLGEAIPGRRAHYREGATLPGRSASEWDKEETLLRRAEGSRAPCAEDRARELTEVGRSDAQRAAPN
jgi:hypothetical protein